MKLLLILMLAVTVSCGKSSGKKANNGSGGEGYCGGNKAMNCMPMHKWSLISESAQFPNEFVMTVFYENRIVYQIDTCEISLPVTRNEGGRVIFDFGLSFIPERNLEIEVTGRGNDCRSVQAYFPKDIVNYGVFETTWNGRKNTAVEIYLND